VKKIKLQFATEVKFVFDALSKNWENSIVGEPVINSVKDLTFDHTFNTCGYLENDILVASSECLGKQLYANFCSDFNGVPFYLINFERDPREVFVEYLPDEIIASQQTNKYKEIPWSEFANKKTDEYFEILKQCHNTNDICYETIRNLISQNKIERLSFYDILGDRYLEPNAGAFSGFCVISPILPNEITEIKLVMHNNNFEIIELCNIK
jgi:hypothetical protein